MTHHFEINKSTNVAFLDVEEAAANAVIRVVHVSEMMGLRSQVQARVDMENRVVLGLIIEDYKIFRREVRMKYLAWHIERVTELLLCSIKSMVSKQSSDDRQLALSN